MAHEEERLERERARSRQRQALRDFRSHCFENAPQTFQDFLQFAAGNAAGFVAVDFDSWRQSATEVAELGIAYVPPPAQLPAADVYEQEPPPGPGKGGKRDRREPRARRREHVLSVAATYLQSRSIRVQGRDRFETDREKYWYQPLTRAEPGDVEGAALGILRGFRGGSGKPCLVAFGLEYELRVLLVSYPRLLEEFSAVIDLQKLVQELYCMRSRPPLRNTLAAYGLECLMRRNGRLSLCAGNDAVRIAVLLAKLLRLPASARPSQATIEHKGPKHSKEAYLWSYNKEFRPRKFWPKGRPMPRELYPYTAVLVLKGKGGIGRFDFPFSDPEGLFAYFERHRPTASGVKLHDKHSQRGYLSFETLEDLDAFIAAVDQEAFDGHEWSVHSKYDPAIQPASSRKEHNQNKREADEAMREARRQQKREKQTAYAEALAEDKGDIFSTMFTS